MANSTVAAANVVTKYEKMVTSEYIRNNRFSKYIGTTENAIFRIREGKQICSFPLIPRLTAAGVSGSTTLRGSGEQLRNFAWTVTPTYYRNACEFTKEEMDKPSFDMLEEARPRLSGWAKELVRDHIIAAMGAIYDGTTYSTYAAATETAKDAWLASNADRVLFGAAKSNNSSNDHSASLSNVDSTNDVLKGAHVSLMKRMAKLADPHITPFRTQDDDQEWYVLFCNSYNFRDLKSDLATSHQNAAPRDMKGNPIWTDGDLVWDGVIVREVPEIDAITGVGASTIDVAPAFLCGAEAVSFGLGQKPTIKVDTEYDFGFNPGVAVELKHQIRKTFFNGIQHGMVTGYFASVAD